MMGTGLPSVEGFLKGGKLVRILRFVPTLSCTFNHENGVGDLRVVEFELISSDSEYEFAVLCEKGT